MESGCGGRGGSDCGGRICHDGGCGGSDGGDCGGMVVAVVMVVEG